VVVVEVVVGVEVEVVVGVGVEVEMIEHGSFEAALNLVLKHHRLKVMAEMDSRHEEELAGIVSDACELLRTIHHSEVAGAALRKPLELPHP